jgi:hypothetical protein
MRRLGVGMAHTRSVQWEAFLERIVSAAMVAWKHPRRGESSLDGQGQARHPYISRHIAALNE